MKEAERNLGHYSDRNFLLASISIDAPEIFFSKYMDTLNNDIPKSMKDILKKYRNNYMRIIPTYMTNISYEAIKGEKLQNEEISNSVGLSLISTALVDDVIDEPLKREERGTISHLGLMLHTDGVLNLYSNLNKFYPEKANDLIDEYKSQLREMIIQNQNDLNINEKTEFNEIKNIQRITMGVPFALGLTIGASLADASKEQIYSLKEYGYCLGFNLKLLYDICDLEKDIANNSISFLTKKFSETQGNREERLKETVSFGLKEILKNLSKAELYLKATEIKKPEKLYSLIRNTERFLSPHKLEEFDQFFLPPI